MYTTWYDIRKYTEYHILSVGYIWTLKVRMDKRCEKNSTNMRGSKVSTAFENILFFKKILDITLKKVL